MPRGGLGGSGQIRKALREELLGAKPTISLPSFARNLNSFKYIHNPIIVRGPPGTWDSANIWLGQVITWGTSLTMYYSGYDGTTWRIGVAYSNDGVTWAKYPGNPILSPSESYDLQAGGTWGSMQEPYVVMHRKERRLYMFYEGRGLDGFKRVILAKSDVGSWSAFSKVGVVLEHTPGEWDEIGVEDPTVLLDEVRDEWYMLYEGTRGTDWISGVTNTGLATSKDGVTWKKYGDNPVLSLCPEDGSGVSALSPNSVMKYGNIYVATLDLARGYEYPDALNWEPLVAFSYDMRHWQVINKPLLSKTLPGVNVERHLIGDTKLIHFRNKWWLYYTYDTDYANMRFEGGVAFLETEPPFTTLILDESTVAHSASTALTNCKLLQLSDGEEGIHSLGLTVEITFHAAATLGARLHVRTSPDNVNWDTVDLDSDDIPLTAGTTVRKTSYWDTEARYVKAIVENLDAAQAITNVKITAHLR